MRLLKNKQKLCSLILTLAVLGSASFGTYGFFNENAPTSAATNKIDVQRIDENHAKIHCNSTKSSDLLFSKSKGSDSSFQYGISDLAGKEKLYEFSSPVDITFDEGLASNPQLNAGIWALAAGAKGAAALGAAAGIVGGLPAAGTAATAIGGVITCGATSAATVGSFGAGAQLAGAIFLAAAGPGAIILGAAALGGAA